MLKLHNFSPKAFRFQVFTTDQKIRPTSAECGLDINYTRVRQSLKRALGEPKVQRLENKFELVKNLANKANGLVSAVHTMMQQSVTQLQQTVTESIRNWLITWVVQKAVQRLLTLIAPLGAVLNALEGIYKTISFFIEQGQRMQFVLKAIQASLNNIAGGQVAAAAAYIEQTLANSLSLTISLLAKLVGVDQVGKRVREFIEGVRAKVQVVVDKLVEKLVKESKDWLNTNPSSQKAAPVNRPAGQAPNQGSSPARPAQQPRNSNPANAGNLTAKLKDREIGETQKFTADGESHRLWIKVGRDRKPILMLASDPKPLVDFLNGPDVQAFQKGDREGHVSAAKNILNSVNYDAEALIKALIQNNINQAETTDQKIETDMQKLAEHIQQIFKKLQDVRLEIAKAVFGDRVFTKQEIHSLFRYLNDRSRRRDMSQWIQVDKKLLTNRINLNDASKDVRYSFNEESLKNWIAANPRGTSTQKTSNDDKIKYYQQILRWASYDEKKNKPSNANFNTTK